MKESKPKDEEIYCYKHNNEISQFYCEDCFQFVCKPLQFEQLVGVQISWYWSEIWIQY